MSQPNPPPSKGPFHGPLFIPVLLSCLVAKFFGCPQLDLQHFIDHALNRTRLDGRVPFAALVLLQRLKARFPDARVDTGHRLFLTSLIVGSKLICPHTYSYESWRIVSQDRFTAEDISKMESELCSFLGWRLDVSHDALDALRASLAHDFALSVTDDSLDTTIPITLASDLERISTHGYEFVCNLSDPSRRRPVPTSSSSSSSLSSVSSPPAFGLSSPSSPSSFSSQETSAPRTPDASTFVDPPAIVPDDVLPHPVVRSTIRSISLLWAHDVGAGDEYGLDPYDPVLCLDGTAMDMECLILIHEDTTPVSIANPLLRAPRIPTIPLPSIS